MENLLADSLKKHKNKVDYLEIRVEESGGTSIYYRGKEIENVSQPSSKGGSVRALYQGGWGFVSFNQINNLDEKIEKAISQAKLVGIEKSQLAPVKPIVDSLKIEFINDPRKIPLSTKVVLTKEYNDLIWSVSPKITDTRSRYSETFATTYFASSEGTLIQQEFSEIAAIFSINAREGNLIQMTHFNIADTVDFDIVKNLHTQIKDKAEMAVKLLEAPPIKAGSYEVIMDPQLSGIFIHEAFGHLSEADHVYENPELKKMMRLGRKVASPQLSTVDDPTLPGKRGSYRYDDEGVAARKTYLIKNGGLVGRLHSRETAGKMGESPTGNARADSFSSRPLVRMSNTYIEGGGVSFKDMIKDIKLGVYAYDSLAGNTDREMFTFSACWGYMIRNGELAELVRDVKLTGNLFTTLKNIEAIGSDLTIDQGARSCGKNGQYVPVSTGGPHLRIKEVIIGGQ